MDEKNLVSVVIPVYNVGKYIKSTVQSVLSQSHQNIEILIIDDGSPDKSVTICRQFSDSRINIIRQNNRGLSGARNTGIRKSSGDYIAFLDGDDIWLPNKLEKHLNHLSAHEDLGVSFSFSQFIDENGLPLGTYVTSKVSSIDIEYLCRANPLGNGSSAVFRKSTLESIKFKRNQLNPDDYLYFDEDLRRSEDYEILFRILSLSSWKIEGIPEPLTLYRINSQGLSANLTKQNMSLHQVLEKISLYNPTFVKEKRYQLLSYHLRYLARSAVRLKLPDQAVYFINQSLFTHWLILKEEPLRTSKAIVMAYLLKVLPGNTYTYIESLFAKPKRFNEP